MLLKCAMWNKHSFTVTINTIYLLTKLQTFLQLLQIHSIITLYMLDKPNSLT